jgi:hypothetical protein
MTILRIKVIQKIKTICAYHINLHFAWDIFFHPPYTWQHMTFIWVVM